MPDLLIELLSEEIPARMQGKAADDLKRLVTDGLVEAGLTYAHAASFATPRRLTLALEGLTERSRPVREERKGPRTDAPEAAVQGFLRATGLTLDRLERRAEKKGEAFFAVVERPGREAAEIVAEVLERTIRDFPWPKSMRWGAGSLRWVRPLQQVLCLLVGDQGTAVVPLEVDGLRAGDATRGHRFHAPEPFSVTSFEDYEAKLRRARVILDPTERMGMIRHDVATLAFARGLEVVEDEGLLAEVAGLVEWPVALMGAVEDQFLGLPPEVLQTSMKEHQKFLSVRNPATGRIEGFCTVANVEATDGGATVLAGNAKVLRARLSDARFFWERDLGVARAGMGEWREGLKSVTFHNRLGSQWERVERIKALAREVAPLVGADPDLAEQAADVAKLDLRSAMVGEFPELQGLMGRYYAEAAGLPPDVAAAPQEHYAPLGPSDAVPSAPVSVAVALADKIDTLTGFWAIDEKPTGSKDPFALRRAALGAIRIIIENGARISLVSFLTISHLNFFIGYLRSLRRVDEILEYYRPLDGDEKPKHRWLEQPIKGFFDFDYLISNGAEEIDAGLAGFDWLEEDNESHNSYYQKARPIYETFKQRVDNAQSFIDVVHFIVYPHDKPPYSTYLEAVWKEEFQPEVWRPASEQVSSDLLAFLHDRLKVHLRDQGIPYDVIDACLAMPGNDDLTLLVRRSEALAAFLRTDDGTNLVQIYKRAANILAQAEERDGVEYSYGADPKWADSPEERALFAALDAGTPRIREAVAREDFPGAMTALASLRAPIDAFFEAVQVNSDNSVIRRNRLNLLSRIRALCLSVADLSRVEG